MNKYSKLMTTIYFISIIILVVGLLIKSSQIWGGKYDQPFPAIER